MPFYKNLRYMGKRQRGRTIAGLKRIRAQMDAEMPRRTRDATIVLGTWNIRNFDDNRFGSGPRSDEDLYYLAEIIARFDIIAIQELCDDLGPLKRLMGILGGHYDYIVTDVTAGPSGNNERGAFIFDRNKVRFTGIAGELVLPDKLQIDFDGRQRQFARTPFMCSFQSGWFKFMFSTVHMYFGAASGAKFERRVDEVKAVASFLAKRAKASHHNYILVGDFNITAPGSPGFNALEKRGFKIFQNDKGSNKDQTKYYSQISYLERPTELILAESGKSKGILQYFDSLYREQDYTFFKPELKTTVRAKIVKIEEKIADLEAFLVRNPTSTSREKKEKKIAKHRASIAAWQAAMINDAPGNAALKKYYMNDWRTFRASDHLPIWVELQIDFSEPYLDKMLAFDGGV